MVTTTLLLIIILLVGYIIWVFTKFFEIVPKSHREVTTTPAPTCEVKPKPSSSVVGSTTYTPLKPPTPKPKRQIPKEEIDDAFMNNEFEQEYDNEPPPFEPPVEEQSEVIDTEDVGNYEQEQIQRTLCIDYEQISASARKVIRGEPLDIKDAETLLKERGTELDRRMNQAIADYQLIISARLAKTDI